MNYSYKEVVLGDTLNGNSVRIQFPRFLYILCSTYVKQNIVGMFSITAKILFAHCKAPGWGGDSELIIYTNCKHLYYEKSHFLKNPF